METTLKFDLPIKPFAKDGVTHDTVRVTVSYDKAVKGAVAHFQTAQTETGLPNGLKSFRFSLFGSPSAYHVVERGWKTNNKKRLALAFDQVRAEIAAGAGDSYRELVKLLGGAGSELLVSVPA